MVKFFTEIDELIHQYGHSRSLLKLNGILTKYRFSTQNELEMENNSDQDSPILQSAKKRQRTKNESQSFYDGPLKQTEREKDSNRRSLSTQIKHLQGFYSFDEN
jgi:hypothetical protein